MYMGQGGQLVMEGVVVGGFYLLAVFVFIMVATAPKIKNRASSAMATGILVFFAFLAA